MVQLEKRLLWHPCKENKFVVGEHSQISLYEWASGHPEIRHITSHHGLHSMKASLSYYGNQMYCELFTFPIGICLLR